MLAGKTNGAICTDCYLYRHLEDRMVGHKILIISYNQDVKKGGKKTCKGIWTRESVLGLGD